MRRFALYGVLMCTACGGGEPLRLSSNVDRSIGLSDDDEEKLTVSQICYDTAYSEGARERFIEFLDGEEKPSEEEQVEIHRQVACVAVRSIPTVAALIEESQLSDNPETVLRGAWLAYDLMDYAGRAVSQETFVDLGAIVGRHFDRLYEGELLTVSRGSYLQAAGSALSEKIASASDADDVLIDFGRCSAGNMRDEAEREPDEDHPPSVGFCGRGGAGGGFGGGSSGGSGDGSEGSGVDSIPGATPEGGNRMGTCLIEAASSMRADMSICVGTPSFGGGGDLGIGVGDFCAVAGGQSTRMTPTVGGKASEKKDGKKKVVVYVEVPFGEAGSRDQAETDRRKNAQSEYERLTKEAFDKGKEIGELEAKERELEQKANSTSPVVTQETKDKAKKQLEETRKKREEAEARQRELNEQANKKKREAEGHSSDSNEDSGSDDDNHDDPNQPDGGGDTTLCEAHMESCNGRCSGGQAGTTTIGGITIGANTSCAVGRLPVSRNEGAMDPPKLSAEQMESFLSCMGLGATTPDFSSSLDTECTKMVCEQGGASSASQRRCTCGGGAELPIDPHEVALNRCNSLIQCEAGAASCSCGRISGGVASFQFGETFDWMGVATLFDVEEQVIAVPFDAQAAPLSVQEDVASPGAHPLEMINNIGATDRF
ncbi:MAG: cell envelope integrity protein TolA [Myxococcota bacterium]